MKMISIKNIAVALLLAAVLIPCAGHAQEDQGGNPGQTASYEELLQMLAPIALYPDPLLSQMLMAATYPFEIAEADRWVTKNPFIKGDALDEALKARDWDVSVLALCHYPKVLTMMTENLSWTARIGDAFANQEEDVMDAIQELRARARDAGNLATTPEQNVIVEDHYIRIEPASPDYVYVPAYDPVIIYGHWWLPLFPPFPIFFPGMVVSGPGIYFSPRHYVSIGVFGWSRFDWRSRNIVIVDIDRTRRYYRHYQRYSTPDRRPWRPDDQRRVVREKRAGEIPRFVPPVRSQPDMRPRDRQPLPGVRTPDDRRDQPRGLGRDRRPGWNQPQFDKSKTGDKNGPGVMEKDRPVVQDRRTIDRDKPADKSRMPEGGRMKVPEQGMNKPPDVRDRGKMESGEPRKAVPAVEQKAGGADGKARERGRGTFRDESGEDRSGRQERATDRGGDRQDRMMERGGDRQDRGGMNREQGERRR